MARWQPRRLALASIVLPPATTSVCAAAAFPIRTLTGGAVVVTMRTVETQKGGKIDHAASTARVQQSCNQGRGASLRVLWALRRCVRARSSSVGLLARALCRRCSGLSEFTRNILVALDNLLKLRGGMAPEREG